LLLQFLIVNVLYPHAHHPFPSEPKNKAPFVQLVLVMHGRNNVILRDSVM
jgi:hypothetical protein